jgi:hypothetical protein
LPDNLNVVGELNRQLQGLNARLMQAEHLIAGHHKAVSEFREIVQAVIPAVSAVQPMLNGLPSGLDQVAANVEGHLHDYVEKILNQTLSKFTAPTLDMITDAAGALLEGQLQSIASQIVSHIVANPIISIVDGMNGNIAHLQSLPSTPEIAAQISDLQSQVASITASNPIINTVTDLRNQIASLTNTISTFTTFLSAQKNLVQGVTRSLKIGT